MKLYNKEPTCLNEATRHLIFVFARSHAPCAQAIHKARRLKVLGAGFRSSSGSPSIKIKKHLFLKLL